VRENQGIRVQDYFVFLVNFILAVTQRRREIIYNHQLKRTRVQTDFARNSGTIEDSLQPETLLGMYARRASCKQTSNKLQMSPPGYN
jgi:hypothetical protein